MADATDRLGEIKQRLAKATPGPWTTDDLHPLCVYCEDVTGSIIARTGGPGFSYVFRQKQEADANATLIAHAPADLAYLLGEVERLTKINEGLVRDFNTLSYTTTKQSERAEKAERERDALLSAAKSLLSDAEPGNLTPDEVRQKPVFQRGDTVSRWVSEGDWCLLDMLVRTGGS